MVTAVIELGAGLALLSFAPAFAELLLGSPLESSIAIIVARVGGAGLLSLSIACWLARDDGQSRAARGLAAAVLLYNTLAVGVLAFAGIVEGLRGLALWPVVMLHAAMAVWCAACLRRTGL